MTIPSLVAFVVSLLASWGHAQTCSQAHRNPSQGVGIDTNGNVWVSGKLNYTLYRYSPDGQTVDAFDISQWGAYGAYGVAVTPVDNDVWVGVGGFKGENEDNRVLRFDYNETSGVLDLLEDIPIIYPFIYGESGYLTNALVVDAEGHVWVTSSAGGPVSVARISPVADPLQHNCDMLYDPAVCSPVDMAVDIDPWQGMRLIDARPDDYGDMTGMVTTRTRAKGTVHSERIRTTNEAVACTQKMLGATRIAPSLVRARRETITQDETPFLTDDILGRELWVVEVTDWSAKVPSFPQVNDRYRRKLSAFIDPETGVVLKLRSSWPAGVPTMPPMVSGELAAKLIESRGEWYHGFPQSPPRITFEDALDEVSRRGHSPTAAKEIIAEYVMWSSLGSEPRPVWIITLRGLPMWRPRADTPPSMMEQYRHIIEADTGKWRFWSTNPRCEYYDSDGKGG